jgi:hypothetical protein
VIKILLIIIAALVIGCKSTPSANQEDKPLDIMIIGGNVLVMP